MKKPLLAILILAVAPQLFAHDKDQMTTCDDTDFTPFEGYWSVFCPFGSLNENGAQSCILENTATIYMKLRKDKDERMKKQTVLIDNSVWEEDGDPELMCIDEIPVLSVPIVDESGMAKVEKQLCIQRVYDIRLLGRRSEKAPPSHTQVGLSIVNRDEDCTLARIITPGHSHADY